jgi:hypothetical protein
MVGFANPSLLTPAQGVECHLARLMIAPDHQQVLAGRGVAPRRIIVHAAVAHIYAINNGKTYRCTALDDSHAHDRYVVVLATTDGAVWVALEKFEMRG